MHNVESIYFFIFVYSILVLSRFTIKFIKALLLTEPKPLVMSNRELLILAATISYIITYITFR